jgi:hypothetical protein
VVQRWSNCSLASTCDKTSQTKTRCPLGGASVNDEFRAFCTLRTHTWLAYSLLRRNHFCLIEMRGFNDPTVDATFSERNCAVKRTLLPLNIGLLLLITPLVAFAGDTDVTPLSNKDVVQMVQSHLSEEAIINAIKSSSCTFDTFPPVLRDLKRRGVTDTILQAMIDAPYGPSERNASSKDDRGEPPIYHYADQLRQMGYLAPTTSGPATFPRESVRMRSLRNTRADQ